METVLYFFSGTGNSLAIAKEIQRLTAAKLVPIASTLDDAVIQVTAEAVGIVTPVYYGGLPNLVKAFLQKLRGLSNHYLFLVVNYGGGFGSSVKTAREIVGRQGGEIAAVYSIHMPQNCFRKPWQRPDKLYAAAERVLATIPLTIAQKKKGSFSTNRLGDATQGILYALLESSYRKHMATLAGLDEDTPIETAIYQSDRTFAVNEGCNGCGTCARVCPVANIAMVDGKPQWLHHCENCLACYNGCPQRAIHSPLVEDQYYYRHPDMKLKDLIDQKKGGGGA